MTNPSPLPVEASPPVAGRHEIPKPDAVSPADWDAMLDTLERRQSERESDGWHEHRIEKRRRVYYQNIVYDVCRMLDRHLGYGPGSGVVCGTADTPCQGVQNELERVLQEARAGESTPGSPESS